MKHILIAIAIAALSACAHRAPKPDNVAVIKASHAKVEAAREGADKALEELNESLRKVTEKLNEVEKLTE